MTAIADLNWETLPLKKDIEEKLVAALHIDPIVARVLINRGLDTVEDVGKFMQVSLEDLHSPMLMSGMKRAVSRVTRAIENKEKVVIFGDYDVDGISATSLLILFFRKLGLEVSFYIPHRVDEGYGLNNEAISKFAEDKVELLISVDCGVTSTKEVEYAGELGIDVIITDHHQVSEKLPPAYAVLNPVKSGCKYPFKYLAGVGIAFKLITAIRTHLVEKGVIAMRDAPNLKHMLDLVALGTLADMVPLIGENHILVKVGLEEMNKSKKIGLRALMNLGNFGSRPVADIDIGFFLAPRLNAIGRLQNAGLGVELLTTNDKFRAKEIAKRLDVENSKRQNIQSRILREVIPLVEKEVDLEKDKAIVLTSAGWHPGVIGIVASKVVEQYNLPTILLDAGENVCRGSARSIPSFHIYDSLAKCKDMLLYFGGHKYAAGLSLKSSMADRFKKEFRRIAAESLPAEKSIRVLEIDSVVPLSCFTRELVEDILELGPFGPQNRYPYFLSRMVKFPEEPYFVGRDNEHVRFEVESGGFRIDGIGYGLSKKFQELDTSAGLFDIVFIPSIVTRGGMSSITQIKLYDIRESIPES